jgi:hypothetical protein
LSALQVAKNVMTDATIALTKQEQVCLQVIKQAFVAPSLA